MKKAVLAALTVLALARSQGSACAQFQVNGSDPFSTGPTIGDAAELTRRIEEQPIDRRFEDPDLRRHFDGLRDEPPRRIEEDPDLRRYFDGIR